jgi:hypothetical protein
MPHSRSHTGLALLPLLVGLVVLTGCGSIGPGRMLMDHTDYNASYTESWKRQILLNIVKVRYVEPIFFLEVGDIVAGYTMDAGGSAGFTRTVYDTPPLVASPTFGNFGRVDFGVSGRYTDRPTFTFKPMTGASFRRGVMSPLPLRNVMAGLESGISAQFLFTLGVRSINGLRNASISATGSMPAQNEFKRVAEILARLQLEDALRVKIEPGAQGKGARLLLSLGGPRPSPEVPALVEELQRLLDLDPKVPVYEIVSDPDGANRNQIALQTYSLMQVMSFVAARVDVPEADVASQRALPGAHEAPGAGVLGAVAVRSGSLPPRNAFAAINYHGHWFWVEDNDLAAKRVFSFLMLAFTLMEDKGDAKPLQLTLPVQ